MKQKITKKPFHPPSPDILEDLMGRQLYHIWISLCRLIEQNYDMERLWNRGGKAWTYEYKYRRGGKTLCALYAKSLKQNEILFQKKYPTLLIFN